MVSDKQIGRKELIKRWTRFEISRMDPFDFQKLKAQIELKRWDDIFAIPIEHATMFHTTDGGMEIHAIRKLTTEEKMEWGKHK